MISTATNWSDNLRQPDKVFEAILRVLFLTTTHPAVSWKQHGIRSLVSYIQRGFLCSFHQRIYALSRDLRCHLPRIPFGTDYDCICEQTLYEPSLDNMRSQIHCTEVFGNTENKHGELLVVWRGVIRYRFCRKIELNLVTRGQDSGDTAIIV